MHYGKNRKNQNGRPVEKGFQMMGKDLAREKEAQEWAEAGIYE